MVLIIYGQQVFKFGHFGQIISQNGQLIGQIYMVLKGK